MRSRNGRDNDDREKARAVRAWRYPIAFDGTHLWVTNTAGNSVTDIPA